MSSLRKRRYRKKQFKRRLKEKREERKRRAEAVFAGMGGEVDGDAYAKLPPKADWTLPEKPPHFGDGSPTPPGCCWWCKHPRHKHTQVRPTGPLLQLHRGACREPDCRCLTFTSPPRRRA